jgi:hypothetical protein
MFRIYISKLIFRSFVLCLVLLIYFFYPEWIQNAIKGTGGFTPIHLIWLLLFFGMILQMLANDKYSKITMGSRKQFARTYTPPEEGYSKVSLYEYILKNNIRSWIVLLVWAGLIAVIGVLYLVGIIDAKEIFLLSIVFYVCDLICVIFWCPFQTFIIKNQCCINCRIFNWGHFMMYSPLLLVKSLFTWSLFFMSIVVLIRWEITYAMHPYRFWSGSNINLRCENCSDQMCKIKKPLTG